MIAESVKNVGINGAIVTCIEPVCETLDFRHLLMSQGGLIGVIVSSYLAPEKVTGLGAAACLPLCCAPVDETTVLLLIIHTTFIEDSCHDVDHIGEPPLGKQQRTNLPPQKCPLTFLSCSLRGFDQCVNLVLFNIFSLYLISTNGSKSILRQLIYLRRPQLLSGGILNNILSTFMAPPSPFSMFPMRPTIFSLWIA